MRRSVTLTAIPILLAATAAPVAARQSMLLRAAPEVGLVSQYMMSTNVSMAMPGGGGGAAATMNVAQTMFTTQTVLSADGDQRAYSMIIDSVDMQMPFGGAGQSVIDEMVGTASEMVMDTRGRIVSMQIVDADLPPQVRQMMDQVQGGMQGLSWELPEDPVAPGDTWSANQTVTFPMGGTGMELALTSTTNYQLLRWERRVAIIGFSGSVGMDADGAAMPVSIEGEVSGEMSFDSSAGRLISFTSTMEMVVESPMAPEGMNMTMAMEMELQGR